MKRKTTLFFFALIVWVLLTWPPYWQNLLIGVVVAIIVDYMAGDMFIKRPGLFKNVKRYFWFLYYVPVFVWECFKANIDVAFRVGHPDILIKPGIVKIKTNLKSDTGLTFLANSITLTPGTLSVDVDQKNGFIYVHWINVKSEDVKVATMYIASKFEKILSRIFE